MNNYFECLEKVDELYREDRISAATVKLLIDQMKNDPKHAKNLQLSPWVFGAKGNKSTSGKIIVATSIDWEQIADEFRKEV